MILIILMVLLVGIVTYLNYKLIKTQQERDRWKEENLRLIGDMALQAEEMKRRNNVIARLSGVLVWPEVMKELK